jgi:hypothetical protein
MEVSDIAGLAEPAKGAIEMRGYACWLMRDRTLSVLTEGRVP